jgi:hypothetical protein
MQTIATHQAAQDYDTERRTFRIHGLPEGEYLRRLAAIASRWPTPRTVRTVDLRRPAPAPVTVAAPSWAPALVSVMQAALECPVTSVRGMP